MDYMYYLFSLATLLMGWCIGWFLGQIEERLQVVAELMWQHNKTGMEIVSKNNEHKNNFFSLSKILKLTKDFSKYTWFAFTNWQPAAKIGNKQASANSVALTRSVWGSLVYLVLLPYLLLTSSWLVGWGVLLGWGTRIVIDWHAWIFGNSKEELAGGKNLTRTEKQVLMSLLLIAVLWGYWQVWQSLFGFVLGKI